MLAPPGYLLGLPPPPAWMRRGVCMDADPDLFFPRKGDNGRDAKRICALCPVADECAAYAAENELHGIWGGTSKGERERAHQAAA